MRFFFFVLTLPCWILALEPITPPGPIKSPQEIQKEIDQSEAEFQHAKEMFVPWYTGPLITPSASMIPPGTLMMQPYAFVNDNYAAFNSERHSVSGPSLVNFNPLLVVQTGLTQNMDFLAILQGNVNWRNNQSNGGLGDLILSPGFLIFSQTRYIPQFKFFLQETFPTGKYQKLNPSQNGLDAVGGGSVKTQIGAIFSKLLFWDTRHPLNLRWSVAYTIPSRVTVHDFNTYGGGYGTEGIVYPGSTFGTDFGLELSLTQEWVFAMDIVYSATGKTRFYGNLGTNQANAPATVGSPSSDNLSLAPAIEYNFSSSMGLIAGTQFSVYGRNSGNFVSGIISFCYVYN